MQPAPGSLYGPGNVSAIPDLFHAAAGLSSGAQPPQHPAGKPVPSADTRPVSEGGGAVKPKAKPAAAAATGGIDEDTIRFLVVGLVSGNQQIQRYIVDNYTVPDVEFMHVLGSTRGREAYYNVFRGATTFFDYHVTFRDIFLTPSKACVWVDLKVKPRISPFRRQTVPCLVLLYFAVDPADGRTKVCLQHDHHSMFALNWIGGAWHMRLADSLLRPAMGAGLVLQGRMADIALAVYQWGRRRLGSPLDPSSPASSVAPEPFGSHNGDNDGPAGPGSVGRGSEGVVGERSLDRDLDECIRQATAQVEGRRVVVPDAPPLPGDSLWSWVLWVAQVGAGVIGFLSALTAAVFLFGILFLLPLP